VNYITQEIELSDEQATVYKNVQKQLIHEFERGEITASNAGVKFLKLLQVAAGWVKLDDGSIQTLDSKPRLDTLIEMFEEMKQKKFVVFSPFRASVEGVNDFFLKKKIKTRFIHGGVNPTTRSNLIREFQTKDIEALVIQPRAASHGITLTASNTIAWHGLDPSGETYKQANGRISRIGQTRKQFIYNFVGCAAERHVLSLLTAKGERSEKVLELFKRVLFTEV
jgi:SNF2 family DNA or RNA helicase